MGVSRRSISLHSFYEVLWGRKVRGLNGGEAGRERHALPFIPAGSRVLDVGCGAGNLLDQLDSPALQVGVDFALSPIAAARSRGHAVALVDLEGPYLPFRDDAFNRVTCLGVIEHLFDPRPLFVEARRVLAPGGLFIVLTPNVRHYYHIFRLAVLGRGPRTSADPEGIDGGHIHYFGPKDLTDLLRDAGFPTVEIRGTDVSLLTTFRSLDILAIARKRAR